MKRIACLLLILLGFASVVDAQPPLFERMEPKKTGVTFKNTLQETSKSNVLTYEYFYNGGGVAAGDINNDGLEDLYFTGNMKPNALYINQGDFKFKEIAASAGVNCPDGWKTGVTMVDVNADGYLDLYVCYSGKGDPEKRRNRLFINNGNLTFTDKAAAYGLNDPGHTTHASFFDYDRDGDLDMYLLNHNVSVIREVEFAKARETRHPYAGDKLFRNDNGRFTDVSEAAGIKGNPLGFGLGVTVADINKDGWTDIYVSNDYIEPDYIYINNRDGTFSDRMPNYLQHLSYFSMGCDVNDFNNDAWPDIFTVDMLPEDNKRQKLLYGPDNYEHFALMVLNGFYFQNMRNMLHLNNGDGTYSEIGQLAGISQTDWSWAPLFADYDNDGWKDLFVTNGYYRDYTNRDFLKYKGDYYFERAKAREKADTFHLVSTMTSTPVHNYIFRNNGDLTFTDESEEWGFKNPDFSNGAAYADLDNDGDLDLIVNNENATASVFKNHARERYPDRRYLQIVLKGHGKNSNAIGTKVSVYYEGKVQYFEQMSTRGFQSSVTNRMHIGLNDIDKLDSIRIDWLSGGQTILPDVPTNQLLTITEPAQASPGNAATQSTGVKVFTKSKSPIRYTHAEQGFNDFKRQPLLLTMLTPCGPIMDTADVNGDGRADVFVGGTEGNPGTIFFQAEGGRFVSASADAFMSHKKFTDADARFVDADGDKDMDLYVVSGGYNDYSENDKALQDRLYLNDGKGRFALATEALPEMLTSKSCIVPGDFDGDGDEDLFVGGRVIPGKYPVAPESFLLQNNSGRFEKVTDTKAPGLSRIGMVTDAAWADLNADGWKDLIVAGEFMSVEIFINEKGTKLTRASDQFLDEPLNGMWNRLLVHDFDKDGDQDIMIGNIGLNTQLRASDSEPVTLVYKDFDNNGSVDPIMNHYIQGKSYPFPNRDELLDQMYSMRSRYTSYAAYAGAQLHTIFTSNELKDAVTLKVTMLETIYLENKNGKLVVHALPAQVQFSPVHAMTLLDYNKDGNMDVILAGNQSSIRIRMGVIDANFGQLLQGDGKGNFTYVSQSTSGLSITGDVKALQMMNVSGEHYLMIGINNVGVESYKLN